jgi:hypothetical protein
MKAKKNVCSICKKRVEWVLKDEKNNLSFCPSCFIGFISKENFVKNLIKKKEKK